MLQTALTALLVTSCGLYAAWSLMPQVLRHALAGGFLRLRLPSALAQRLRAMHVASATAGGCGAGACSGCASGGKTSSKAAAVQPLVFHPSRPSRQSSLHG